MRKCAPIHILALHSIARDASERDPMQNDKNGIAQLTSEQNTLFNAMFGMQS